MIILSSTLNALIVNKQLINTDSNRFNYLLLVFMAPKINNEV